MKKKGLFSFFTVLLAVIIISTLFLSGCSKTTTTTQSTTATSSTQSAPQVYKIGMIASLTGWLGAFDQLQVNEAQLGVDIINEAGGFTVKGQKYTLQLVVEDGQSSTDGCLAAANKLIFSDGVKFIAGPDAWFGSAVSGICESNKIMHILGCVTMQPGEMDATTTWAFLGGTAVVEPFFQALPYLKENYPNVKKVVLLQPDDGSIPYVGPVAKKALQDAGYTVVGDVIGYDNAAVDFSSYAAKVVASGADCCFSISGLATAYGSILKDSRALGSNMVWAIAGGQSVSDLLTIAGPDALKNCFDAAFDNNPPNMVPWQEELGKRIEAKMGAAVPQAYEYANPCWEFVQLFEKAQSFDPSAVRAAFESSTTLNTFFGPGTIGGLKTYGIKHAVTPAMPIFTFDGGKLTFQKYEPGILP